MQVEVCPCDFACLKVVYKTCLLLEIVAACSQLVFVSVSGIPRRECGHTKALQGTLSGSRAPAGPICILVISCTAQAHPVHSPHIRQMPAKALTPGNYSACFNTASCCQGKVMALALFFIVRDSQ